MSRTLWALTLFLTSAGCACAPAPASEGTAAPTPTGAAPQVLPELLTRPEVVGTCQVISHERARSALRADLATDPEVVVQSGHSKKVNVLALSPDSSLVATAGGEGLVKVWDVRLGREVRTCGGVSGPLYAVQFSPDGRYVAAAGLDHHVFLWSVTDGHLVSTLKGHQEPIGEIAFSRTGRYLASVERGGVATLWEVASREPIHVVEPDRPQKGGCRIAFTPDETLLAIAYDGKVEIRDTRSWERVHHFLHTFGPTLRMGFHPDGRTLILASETHTDTYDLASGQFACMPDMWLGLRPRDGAVCTLPEFGVVQYTDPTTGRVLGRLEFPGRPDQEALRRAKQQLRSYLARWDVPSSMTVLSPDGTLLACPTTGTTACVWDAATGRLIQQLGGRVPRTFDATLGNMASPVVMTWSPTEPVFALADRDVIRFVDLRAGGAVRVLQGHREQLTALAFSRDGKSFASASEKDVRVWDVASGRLTRTLDAGRIPGTVESVTFDKTGAQLLTGHLVVWKAGELPGSVIRTWNLTSGSSQAFEPVPANSAEVGGNIVITQGLRSGAPSSTPYAVVSTGLSAAGGKLVLSPDGLTAYTMIGPGWYSKGLSLWDVRERKVIRWQGFRTLVSRTMAVSPNGLQLAIGLGGRDPHLALQLRDPHLIALLDARAEKAVGALRGHAGIVYALAFSPDGTLLASGSADGTVRLWDPAKGTLLATFSDHHAEVWQVAFSHDGRFLASAGYDHCVRLWDVATRRPAAVFSAFGQGEYVWATPDGSYMASRQGLAAVAFRIGNKVYPFEQFDLQKNRPDEVARRLGYAPPELVEGFRTAREQRLRRMQFQPAAAGAVEVPRLTVLQPPPPAPPGREARLRVRAEAGSRLLNRVLASVNGVPVWGATGHDLRSHAATAAELEVTVRLSAGANKIQLSVLNDAGQESLAETFEVAGPPAEAKPTLYVLAVGVSKYQDPRLALRYAAKDAQDVAEFFKAHGRRFGAVRVRQLLDGDVTRENLRATKRFLAESRVDDQVVVFLAGHGFLGPKFDYYFGTADIDPKSPADRGMAYADLEDLFDGIPARRRVLLMDTCHAGEVDPDVTPAPADPPGPQEKGRGGDGGAGDPPVTAFRAFERESEGRRLSAAGARSLLHELFADLRRGCGAAVIGSAGGREYAVESDRWRNGVFTFAVLEGLTGGKADHNGDGEVRVSELRDYVFRRVPELTRGRQTPTARRENLDLDFPLY